MCEPQPTLHPLNIDFPSGIGDSREATDVHNLIEELNGILAL